MPTVRLLTQDVQDAFCALLRKGLHETTARDMMEIPKATLNNWKKWGEEQEDGIYRDFLSAISKAKAKPIDRMIGSIVDMIEEKGDGYLALKWLQTAYPHLYGKYAHASGDPELQQLPVAPTANNTTNILAITLQTKLLETGLTSPDAFAQIMARVTGVQLPPVQHVYDAEVIDEPVPQPINYDNADDPEPE